MVKEMFDAFSTIDIHDHLRQGSLEMERQWITRSWVLRLFMTMLGMIIVNAYKACEYMTPADERPADFNEFLGKLAYQLINNRFLEEEAALRATRQTRQCSPKGTQNDFEVHRAELLSTLPVYEY
jgi:hypothetical protein